MHPQRILGFFFIFLVGVREGHISKDQEQKFRGLYIDISLLEISLAVSIRSFITFNLIFLKIFPKIIPQK